VPNAGERGTARLWVASFALITLTVAAIGAGVLVGFHVRDHGGFNWGLAAVVGTATGTTLLAVVTGALAIVTTADVQATRQIAQVSRREQQARERPIVLLEDVSITIVNGVEATMTVHLRNAGVGVAVRGTVECAAGRGDQQHGRVTIYVTSLVSGEQKPVEATLTLDPPLFTNVESDWFASGIFLDAAGQSHKLTDGQWRPPKRRVRVIDPPLASN
jgi:hypothetical protein